MVFCESEVVCVVFLWGRNGKLYKLGYVSTGILNNNFECILSALTLSGDVYEPIANTAATIITPTRAKDSTDDDAFIALEIWLGEWLNQK